MRKISAMLLFFLIVENSTREHNRTCKYRYTKINYTSNKQILTPCVRVPSAADSVSAVAASL